MSKQTHLTREDQPRPIVGAIRWDAWTGGDVTAQVERSLGPRKYHHRLPWFTEVIGEDTARIDGSPQAIMDREIDFAADAGLAYWAFLLYEEQSSMSKALAQYLASARRGRINFSVILHNAFGVSHEKWPAERDRAVALLKEPGFQTVLGGRPLVYVFEARFRGEPATDRVMEFRRMAAKAGLNPYMVFMGWDPSGDFKRQSPNGYDAVSAYAYCGNQPQFTQLARSLEDNIWQKAAKASVPYVPLVTAGWEKWPRKEHPVSWELDHDYHRQDTFPSIATPKELAAHLGNALAFVQDHPDICAAKAVVIYAWNEHDEGGWISPTWTPTGPDKSRLNAIRAILSQVNRP